MKFKFLVLVLALSFFATQLYAGVGAGGAVKKERACEYFNEITLKGFADITVTKGATNAVVIETAEGQHENVITEFSGSEIVIYTNGKFDCDYLHIYLTTKDLVEVEVKGSGDITGDGKFSGEEFEVGIYGSGDIKFDLDYKEVEVEIAGSGDVTLKGTANELEVEIKGSGDVDCFDMKANKCEIDIKGSGDTKVWAVESLDAKIFGSGDIVYKGEPSSVSKKVYGSGDIKKK